MKLTKNNFEEIWKKYVAFNESQIEKEKWEEETLLENYYEFLADLPSAKADIEMFLDWYFNHY